MEDKEDEIDLIALDSFCQLVLEENIDEIEVLLTSSPELANAMDKWNWTPLHYAAMRGKIVLFSYQFIRIYLLIFGLKKEKNRLSIFFSRTEVIQILRISLVILP